MNFIRCIYKHVHRTHENIKLQKLLVLTNDQLCIRRSLYTLVWFVWFIHYFVTKFI